MEKDPQIKAQSTEQLYTALLSGLVYRSDEDDSIEKIERPGRPDKPVLVHHTEVPKRNFGSKDGRVKLAHAIAHIEFNAINLALDAVYRFRDMPDDYYSDWLQVAAEEAKHFSLLNAYLEKHGSYYGTYTAHNGLWEMALKTDHDVLVRMALVPRVLEARGLDVTRAMIERLFRVGDTELAEILEVIYEEEIRHVEKGNHWFGYLCQGLMKNSEQVFRELIETYMKDAHFGPFDVPARLKAGFSENELKYLASRNR